MLLSPKAVERLKAATAINSWPHYRTHAQRNELSHMFTDEIGRLLDQRAETTIKHLIELYSNEELSYEEYLQRVEEVSKEEQTLGAAQGGEYARNRVFDFAQKALDKEQARTHALCLLDAKKQHELERQKAESIIKETLRLSLDTLQTKAQEYQLEGTTQTKAFQETIEQSLEGLKTILHKQEEDLQEKHEEAAEQTKTNIELIITTQFREERSRREKEIQEEEDRRPVRDAARLAIEQVKQQERRARNNRRLKNGLIGLAIVFSLSLFVLLFFPRLQWAQALALVLFIATILTLFFWKPPVSEDTLAEHKKQIMLFQTKNGDYAALDEEERCTLLTQKIL